MALKENKYAMYICNLISLYNIKYIHIYSNKILYTYALNSKDSSF